MLPYRALFQQRRKFRSTYNPARRGFPDNLSMTIAHPSALRQADYSVFDCLSSVPVKCLARDQTDEQLGTAKPSSLAAAASQQQHQPTITTTTTAPPAKSGVNKGWLDVNKRGFHQTTQSAMHKTYSTSAPLAQQASSNSVPASCPAHPASTSRACCNPEQELCCWRQHMLKPRMKARAWRR